MAKKGKRGKRGAPPAAAAGHEPGRAPHAAAAAAAPAPVAAPAPADSSAELAPGSRALANALILAFLAFQVAMPLRYYLGGRGYDERFSWRMFSTLRMHSCKVQVRETVGGVEQPLNLKKEVQVAWIGMLERYRRPVVDKLLARRCDRSEASRVVFSRSCTDTDGSALPETTVSRDCGSGKVVAVEGSASVAALAGVAP